jgi:predicted DNA-binding WGR domain protein
MIMQTELFPDQMLLRREDTSRNMRRFYLMVVQRDLFGGVSLVREWGRVGSGGQVRFDHYPDEGRALDALAALASAKRKRGYL